MGLMAEDVENNNRGRAFAWCGLLIIGLPVLYALSIGPVAAITNKTGYQSAAMQFYQPVIWLHEHTVLRRPLEIYVGLFGIK
jgi:hypothetical protein